MMRVEKSKKKSLNADINKVELKIAERIFHGSLRIFVGFKHVHFTLRIQGLRILLLIHWETATVSELG